MKLKSQIINQGNQLIIYKEINRKDNIDNLNNELGIDIKNIKDKNDSLHQLINENKEI